MSSSKPAWIWPLALGLLAAAAYVQLRFAMNHQYEYAKFGALLRFKAPLPFGHRVLVPLLAKPLVAAGLGRRLAFAVWEMLAVVGLVASLRYALSHRLPSRHATALAVAFVLVLPFAYLLRYRWPIFYPWDTPSMLAIALGIGFLLRGRYVAATVLTGIAALNRETAIAIPIVALALGLATAPGRRSSLAWAGIMVVVFAAVRQGIALALPENPGPALHFTVGGEYRVFTNLKWLRAPRHALQLLGSMAALPLLWPLLLRYIDRDLARLHLVALGLFAALLVVGNLYEPRAFGEVLVLLWVPLAVGFSAWLRGEAPGRPAPTPRWLEAVDRYGALAIVAGFVLFAAALDRFAFLPVAQWPMP